MSRMVMTVVIMAVIIIAVIIVALTMRTMAVVAVSPIPVTVVFGRMLAVVRPRGIDVVAPRVTHTPSIPQGGIFGKPPPITPARDPWCRGRIQP